MKTWEGSSTSRRHASGTRPRLAFAVFISLVIVLGSIAVMSVAGIALPDPVPSRDERMDALETRMHELAALCRGLVARERDERSARHAAPELSLDELAVLRALAKQAPTGESDADPAGGHEIQMEARGEGDVRGREPSLDDDSLSEGPYGQYNVPINLASGRFDFQEWQERKLHALLAEYEETRREVCDTLSDTDFDRLTPAKRAEHMRSMASRFEELQGDFDANFKAILDSGQRAVYQEYQRRTRMRHASG